MLGASAHKQPWAACVAPLQDCGGPGADVYAEELACCLVRYVGNNAGGLEGCNASVATLARTQLTALLAAFPALAWSAATMQTMLGTLQ